MLAAGCLPITSGPVRRATLGNVVRQLEELREGSGVSRKQLAGRLQKTRQAVDAALRGRSRISLEDAEEIADMLGARIEVAQKGNAANLLRRALDADAGLTDEWREVIWAAYETAKRRQNRPGRRGPPREPPAAASSST